MNTMLIGFLLALGLTLGTAVVALLFLAGVRVVRKVKSALDAGQKS